MLVRAAFEFVVGRAVLSVVVLILVGCSAVRPSVVTAVDEPFPAAFAEAGQWQATELVPLPGSPQRLGSLDAVLQNLDSVLKAGIKASRPDSGVRITVPDGASNVQEVHLFVTVIGGATNVSSGSQWRLVIRRDANGWWLDPHGEMRIYCDQALSGFGHNSCH